MNKWLTRLLVVRKCASCREILTWEEHEEALCTQCKEKWNFSKVETCPQYFHSAVECQCMPKLLAESGAERAGKLFFYHPTRSHQPSHRLLYFLKHQRNRRVLNQVAEELWAVLQLECDQAWVNPRDDGLLLVSIPRGWTAKSLYGFDQSEWICRSLSDVSGIPYANVIRRRWGGNTQKKLNRKERMKNVKRSLYLSPKALETAKLNLSAHTVILFDDLVTTGATMGAAVSLLHRAGVRQVLCLSLASEP